MGLSSGCSELRVFAPKKLNFPGSSEQVSINEDGYLVVTIDDERFKGQLPWTLSVKEWTEDPSQLGLLEQWQPSDTLDSQSLTIKSELGPAKNGVTRLQFLDSPSLIWPDTMDSEAIYIVETKRNSPNDDRNPNSQVTVIRSTLKAVDSVETSISGKSVRMQWPKVPSALHYEIYRDSSMSELIGKTSELQYDIEISGTMPPSLWIRPIRGSLKAALIEVPVSLSSLKVTEVEYPTDVFRAGETASFTVTYSGIVQADSLSNLSLDATGRSAAYASGSGTNKIIYRYTIAPTDQTFALAPGVPTDLSDSQGKDIYSPLPTTTGKTVIVDNTAPTLPSNILFDNPATSLLATLTFTASQDENLLNYEGRLCKNSDCSTECQASSTTETLTFSFTNIPNATYWGCVRAHDKAGFQSGWASSAASVTISDGASPTVNVGADLLVSVSSIIDASTSVDPDLIYSWTKVSGPGNIVFTTPEEEDTFASASLDGTYVIRLTVTNALGNSVYDELNFVWDSTAPSLPSSVGFSGLYSATLDVDLSFNLGSDPHLSTHNLKLCTNAACSLGCVGATSSASSPASLSGDEGEVYYGCVQAIDTLGHASAFVNSTNTITLDTLAPTAPSIEIAANDALTDDVDVSLDLSAVAASEMYVTNTAACAAEVHGKRMRRRSPGLSDKLMERRPFTSGFVMPPAT